MKTQFYQAGNFDRYGSLFEAAPKDGYGHQSKKAADLLPIKERIPCKKEEVSGQEKESADRLTAFGRVDFVIRWREGVKPVQVWTCEGVTYDIKAVQEIGRKRYLKLNCVRRD